MGRWGLMDRLICAFHFECVCVLVSCPVIVMFLSAAQIVKLKCSGCPSEISPMSDALWFKRAPLGTMQIALSHYLPMRHLVADSATR